MSAASQRSTGQLGRSAIYFDLLPDLFNRIGVRADIRRHWAEIPADEIPCSRDKIPCSAKIIPCSIE